MILYDCLLLYKAVENNCVNSDNRNSYIAVSVKFLLSCHVFQNAERLYSVENLNGNLTRIWSWRKFGKCRERHDSAKVSKATDLRTRYSAMISETRGVEQAAKWSKCRRENQILVQEFTEGVEEDSFRTRRLDNTC